MPEGPEVKITADGLSSYMKGKLIKNIIVTPASRYYKSEIENLDDMSFPILVEKIKSKGKKIVFICKNKYDKRIILVSSLGMEGKWRPVDGKHAGIQIVYGKSNKTMYFHDTRHFGSFNICTNQSEYDDVMKAVGPDLLSDDISLEDYEEKITKKSIRNKEICSFMMEQKYFSGIGNYLLAEILYACKILPTRLLKDLSEKDIKNLWKYSRKIIKDSYKCGGLTIATYLSIEGEKGTYETKVYGRKRDPEGNPVKTQTFSNGRTSHFVPAVQI